MKRRNPRILNDTCDIQCPRDSGHRLRSVTECHDGLDDCLASSSLALDTNGVRRKFRSVLEDFAWIYILLVLLSTVAKQASAQCQGPLTSPEDAAHCTAGNSVPMSKAEIDPKRPYRLEELIDIAESNNPRGQTPRPAPLSLQGFRIVAGRWRLETHRCSARQTRVQMEPAQDVSAFPAIRPRGKVAPVPQAPARPHRYARSWYQS